MQPQADNIKTNLQLYPHVQDPKTSNDARYDRNKYISIQTRVNNDPEFEKKYIRKIAMDGWVALKNPSILLYYPKGTSFKYRLNGDSMSGAPEGTFRSGGWLLGRNENDDNKYSRNNYILYKGFNGAIFSLQIKDILEAYVKSKKKEIPVFKKPDPNNPNKRFPVYLTDPNTDENVIVYYAKDNNAKNRFMSTNKYKLAKMYGIWSWSATFNENNI